MEIETLKMLRAEAQSHRTRLEQLHQKWGDKAHASAPSRIHLPVPSEATYLTKILLTQVTTRCRQFQESKKERRLDARRWAKAVERHNKEKKAKEQRRRKEKRKFLEARARGMSGLVFRDFWKSCHKIVKFKCDSQFKARKKLENKRKVDGFLKMQSRLADEILTEIRLSHGNRRVTSHAVKHGYVPRVRIEDFDGKNDKRTRRR